LGEGGSPDGRVEGDIPAEGAGVLGPDVAPAALLRPSGAPLAGHVSPLPFLPGGNEMRIHTLHHLVEESLLEVNPLPGRPLQTMRTVIEIAGARSSGTAGASPPAWSPSLL
jgi:hypothetical protein